MVNDVRVHASFPYSRKTAIVNTSKLRWNGFKTSETGVVEITTGEASKMDAFLQWIAIGLTSAEDIAREMGVSKGTVSKWAKKAIDGGKLKKDGR
jgi:hypothetical protein